MEALVTFTVGDKQPFWSLTEESDSASRKYNLMCLTTISTLGNCWAISILSEPRPWPYLRFSVSVFVEDGVGADEDENPDAHGEGAEHLHPLRVAMLFQEPRQSAPRLLGERSCEQECARPQHGFLSLVRGEIEGEE